MAFPINDVENNFRQFIVSVKRATGNAKDPDAVDRKVQNSGGRHSTCSNQYIAWITHKYSQFSYTHNKSYAELFSWTWN
jgi:hypothetical protein